MDGTIDADENLTAGGSLYAGDRVTGTNVVPPYLATVTIFSDGFESGSLNTGLWYNTGDYTVINDADVIFGNYSVRLNPNTGFIQMRTNTIGYANLKLIYTLRIHSNEESGDDMAVRHHYSGSWQGDLRVVLWSEATNITTFTDSLSERDPLAIRFTETFDDDYLVLDDIKMIGDVWTTTTTNYTNTENRAFTSFDISGIPANANITAATLNFMSYSNNNGVLVDPFRLDHVNFGAALDGADFNAPSFQDDFASFATETAVMIFDVTDRVFHSLTNVGAGSRFQVRIRPDSVKTNITDDGQYIKSSEETSVPYLRVDYIIPAGIPLWVTNTVCISGNNLSPSCAGLKLDIVDIIPDDIIDHFVISHDTNALVNQWELFTVSAMSSNNLPVVVGTNIGTITIDVINLGGPVMWSNGSGQGTFITNAGLLIYTFTNTDNGTVQFYIKDDTVESVNIEIANSLVTTATDDDTEGWMQFQISVAALSISKSILNVTLGGSPIAGPVPGSTVTYSVYYSNTGSTAGNMIIYDRLPANVIYFSNSSPAGWGAQYSYDDPPASQAFLSANYSNMPPPPVSSNVRWIRWTNSSVADSEIGVMIYSVIIK